MKIMDPKDNNKQDNNNEVIKLLNEIEQLKAKLKELENVNTEYQKVKQELETIKKEVNEKDNKRVKNSNGNSSNNEEFEKIKIEYQLITQENERLKQELENYKKEITQKTLMERLKDVRDEVKEDFVNLYFKDIEIVNDEKGIIKIGDKVNTLDNYLKELKKNKAFYFKDANENNDIDLSLELNNNDSLSPSDNFEKEFLNRLKSKGVTNIKEVW
jgi:chromosome segregation ATPase